MGLGSNRASFAWMLLFFNVVYAQSEEAQTWSCPTGWKTFTSQSAPIDCLWISARTTNSYDNAHDICKAFDATLVTVFSEEKFRGVLSLLMEANKDSTWTGLKEDGYSFVWQTMDGSKEMTYGTIDLSYYNYGGDDHCGVISTVESVGVFARDSCSASLRTYICEKAAECKPGWYGHQCDNQCHCHGQQCDSSKVNVTCPFGCQPGWTGLSCNKQTEKAEASYHCVKPSKGENRVTIWIDTKGTTYRAIEAIDDEDKPVPWCNGTEISSSNETNSVTITISMGDESTSEIGQTCAGKNTGNQTYKWRISLKEWKGILLPMDEIIEVQCDFNKAESLSRTGDPVITEEVQATSVSQLDATQESVTVKLVDPASKTKLFSSTIGNPVILQVQHKFATSNKVQSIFPHHCVAIADDGTQQIHLLDSDGCQVQGSPVQPFAKTSQPNTLETPWFPYFGFKASDSVVFRCSFVFCFDQDCPVGCQPNGLWPLKGRHVRSTRDDVTHQAEDRVGVSK